MDDVEGHYLEVVVEVVVEVEEGTLHSCLEHCRRWEYRVKKSRSYVVCEEGVVK